MPSVLQYGYMSNREDFFMDPLEEQDRYADTRPLTEKADPLALSWASYAVYLRSPQRRWVPFSDVEAHEHDHHMAEVTRRYYRNRLALEALRSNDIPSRFRRDLYDICNGGIMRHKHLGMIYRLPYFYVEDTSRDELVSQFPLTPRGSKPVPRSIHGPAPRRLVTVGQILRSRSRQESMQYWFRDENQHPVVMHLELKNPLHDLAKSIFGTPEQENLVRGRFYITQDPRRDFYYWTLANPELITSMEAT